MHILSRVAGMLAGVALLASGSPSETAATVKSADAPSYVDTLSYFINQSGRTLNGSHTLSQTTIDRSIYYVKWTDLQFEEYSYDDQYIYLREDRSDPARTYTFTDGRWMKRSMRIGESVVAGTNRIQHFAVQGAKCTPAEQGIFPYTTTLLARYPTYDLGAVLGVRDVIVLRYDYRNGVPGDYEQMYYAKGLGLVKWELYRDDRTTNSSWLVQVSAFDRYDATPPPQPNTDAACKRIAVPQRVPSLPMSVDEFVGTLYRCVLGKEPDPAGFQEWAGKLRRGALSPQGSYVAFFQYQGAVTDDRFARRLYACTLHREIDQGSYDNILRGLRNGSLTRTGLVQAILGSAEFTSRVLPALKKLPSAAPPPAPPLPTTTDGFVDILYRCVLSREADESNRRQWVDNLRRGAVTPRAAYTSFFQNQGAVTDEWFAHTLYRCALYREIDPGAYDNILRGLRTGALTRAGLVQAVLGSAEFTSRVLPALQALR